MNVVVTVKHVADPNIPPASLQRDTTGTRIIPPFESQLVMNGYDANALEEALRLREQYGGRVTAISMGDGSCHETLRRALAMGADAAFLVDPEDWPANDSAGTAVALSAAVRKLGSFDLVLCGRQASDTDAGQVPQCLAEILNLPAVTPVSRIEQCDGKSLIVHRIGEGGYQRIRVELPALLGISSEINEPRYPPLRGIMAAKRAMIPAWTAAQLSLEPVSARVELKSLRMQERGERADLVRGSSGAEIGIALANKLYEEGLL